ncbi:MAG: hypothetical protein DRN27_09765 [Thermoplasmata archaeon]|nr:MAG: hypothetical protein DRN27_09765 [Thermoplasmata archaeon]
MGKKTCKHQRAGIPPRVIEDVQDYRFQDRPDTCWITSIKNISKTMKRYHSDCPSPNIKRFNKVIGAKFGIIPNYQKVSFLINKYIYNNTKYIVKEQANSDIKELKSILENTNASPVIISVHLTKYLNIMKNRYDTRTLGYEVEDNNEIEGYDHVLIALDCIGEDLIFFDTYTPYLHLDGENTKEKAIFKLPMMIVDAIWLEARVEPRWMMYIKKESPFQKRLEI